MTHTPRNRTSISRRTLLRGSAAVGLAAAGLSVNAAGASAAVTSTKIKDLVGTQTPVQYGIGATDLGIPAIAPDGRAVWVFGDTWLDHVGGTNWRSPVALYSGTTNPNAGVTFNGCAGNGATTQAHAPQLWYYPHDHYFTTVIPSDVITIGGTMYLHAIVNGPHFGAVRWTEVWQSTDSGATWQHTGLTFPGDKDGGYFQCITWGQGNDGYVYLFATGFQRDKGIKLYRVPETQITNGAAYQPWGWNGSHWVWGATATEVLPGGFGEMCLRPLGGKWLLTYFNAQDYRIDAMVLNTPTDNLHTAAKTTLLWGGEWGSESHSHVAQLYGGYVIPGSSLSDLHLSVSQWKTADNSVYHSMQFRIQGLL
ncbi:DUF4185 domain-containing protein [Ruania halotolerans]|uniref:DUF4185 domain-containing protein n=1 Tax=Ruania halotolerans TaxID=2897773 RepID=UPI001E4A78CC|nr:DUF4185 domain-containing protein [Ruania halotolerans]UFU06002.1 DUF4185 domain-containing protein [Ruania halotolerans]